MRRSPLVTEGKRRSVLSRWIRCEAFFTEYCACTFHFNVWWKITPSIVREGESDNAGEIEVLMLPWRLLSIRRIFVFCWFRRSPFLSHHGETFAISLWARRVNIVICIKRYCDYHVIGIFENSWRLCAFIKSSNITTEKERPKYWTLWHAGRNREFFTESVVM